MKSKKVLILGAHPQSDSLSEYLLNHYAAHCLASGHDIKVVKLSELEFEYNLTADNRESPGEVIQEQQNLVLWCEHLVLFTPLWWMGFPAQMKAWVDRVLLNGFAFEYRKGLPVGLLKGRSMRVIYTQAQPQWYCWLFKGDSFFKMIKSGVFGFCGFNPLKRLVISNVRKMNESKLKKIKVRLTALAYHAN